MVIKNAINKTNTRDCESSSSAYPSTPTSQSTEAGAGTNHANNRVYTFRIISVDEAFHLASSHSQELASDSEVEYEHVEVIAAGDVMSIDAHDDDHNSGFPPNFSAYHHSLQPVRPCLSRYTIDSITDTTTSTPTIDQNNGSYAQSALLEMACKAINMKPHGVDSSDEEHDDDDRTINGNNSHNTIFTGTITPEELDIDPIALMDLEYDADESNGVSDSDNDKEKKGKIGKKHNES